MDFKMKFNGSTYYCELLVDNSLEEKTEYRKNISVEKLTTWFEKLNSNFGILFYYPRINRMYFYPVSNNMTLPEITDGKKIRQIKEYVLSVYRERVAENYFFNLFEDEDAPYMIETDNGLYVWPYFDYGGVRATYDVNSIEIIQSNGKSATFKISFYYDDLSDIQDCEIRLVKENNKWVFDQLPYYDDLK